MIKLTIVKFEKKKMRWIHFYVCI